MADAKLWLKSIALQVPILLARTAVKLGQSSRMLRLMGRNSNAPSTKRRAFAGYTPTAADVIVATFAKSGTNWMMQIAQQIAYFGEAEFEYLHELIPWPEAPMTNVPARLSDAAIAAKAPTGLRVIKTHYERDYVPFSPVAKYIVVVRDPKDVFVSSYYFGKETFGALTGIDYSLAEWLELFQTADFIFGSWAEHTASWWSVRDEPNVLLLIYDEMKRDPRQGIQRVAELMAVPLTAAQLDKVVTKSSFAYMKTHEHLFSLPPPPFGSNMSPTLIRKGESGASAELITQAQQAVIDRFCQAELQRLGSDFPYTAVFPVVSAVAADSV
jgi:hypothetical protein